MMLALFCRRDFGGKHDLEYRPTRFLDHLDSDLTIVRDDYFGAKPMRRGTKSRNRRTPIGVRRQGHRRMLTVGPPPGR